MCPVSKHTVVTGPQKCSSKSRTAFGDSCAKEWFLINLSAVRSSKFHADGFSTNSLHSCEPLSVEGGREGAPVLCQDGWRTFLTSEKHSDPGPLTPEISNFFRAAWNHTGHIPVTGEAAEDREELCECQECVCWLELQQIHQLHTPMQHWPRHCKPKLLQLAEKNAEVSRGCGSSQGHPLGLVRGSFMKGQGGGGFWG